MAETESEQTGKDAPAVSNTMGAIIIALLLILGGVIIYQNYQLEMAMKMLQTVAPHIEKPK
jgi:hypothetical protein